MRFGGHSNPNTFFNSYMSQLSTVDGQGSFFGQALRRDHLEDFRGLSLHRHPNSGSPYLPSSSSSWNAAQTSLPLMKRLRL